MYLRRTESLREAFGAPPSQYRIGSDESLASSAANAREKVMTHTPVSCSMLSALPLPPVSGHWLSGASIFVDPGNCSLLNSLNHNPLYKNRHYSYATYGELDSFTYTKRLRSLRGEVFSVGYASNSGSWKGAYNPSGSFAANDPWTVPIVEFVREAALMGGFAVNMTRPPDWLRPKSWEFFGTSNFGYCVYTVSLG